MEANSVYKTEAETVTIKVSSVCPCKVTEAVASGQPTVAKLRHTGLLVVFSVGRNRTSPNSAVLKVSGLIIKNGLVGPNCHALMAQIVSVPIGHLEAPLATAINL